MAGLEIFTLGGVRILQDGKLVDGLNNRKAEALLIYLASTRRPQPREVLADLLWDERTQSQALANLRVVLTILRQTVGECISISREMVGINPSTQVWLDTTQFEDGLYELHLQGRLNTSTASKAVQALDLYRGDFLEGFSVTDCRRFEDWQGRERERLHHLAVDGYSELVAYDIELRDYQLGLVHAARLLELDPLMELAHRQMMLLLAKCGQRMAALNQYETYRKLLQSELNVEPGEETRNLKEQIRTGKLETIEEVGQIPSGTVTFLFVEVADSAELLERLREQFALLLNEYHLLVQSTIKKWHGHEIALQGDSFLAAFGRATDALACTIEFKQRLAEQQWPQGVNVLVRMGLHTGEPVVGHTGYIGIDVHRAARIAGAGYGGQVLLSRTTRDLVYLSLPNECRLRDLGTHALKDSEYPQEIYQLDIPGLPGDFAPLKSEDKFEKVEEPPAPGQSPYIGMKNFEESDAEWFYGRQSVTERLVEAVRSHDFLAVIGASGSGKSSVVRAGLVPAIKMRYPSQWQVKVITPSSHPLEALAICLTKESESISATTTLIDDMLHDSRSLYLYWQKQLTNKKSTRLLLIIDQFEELFTLCRSVIEQGAFVNNLIYSEGMPGSSITIVMALRADFYAHLAQFPGLPELVSAQQIFIGAMKLAELREAIEGPAQHGGWEFSPGLVDLIISDLGAGDNRQPEPGALPLLSHALLETWKRRSGSIMNLKAYMEAGGVRGAIAKTAESVYYQDLTPAEQGIAKDIFLRLTELGEGTQDTRRRISIKELIPPGPAIYAEQIQAVLVKLADARLITTGEGTVEVAHEALIREWPALREWLATDREGLRLHRHLTEAAQEWELLERDPDALYRGARLNQALEWVITNPGTLNVQEQSYLEASRDAAEREQAEREAARVRELEAARKLAETEKGRADAERQRAEDQSLSAKRLRRRAWWLAGVMLTAIFLAAIAAIFWRQSDIKGREATSRFLNSAALNNVQLNPQLSAHLALQAIKVFPEDTLEAENTLHQVLPELRLLSTTPISITRPGYLPSEATLYMVRNGELFIHTTPQGIELVDWASGARSMLAAVKSCGWPQPSGNGRWLVVLCQIDDQTDGSQEPVVVDQVWDAETQQLLFTLPDVDNLFSGLPFDYPIRGIIPPTEDQPLRVWASTWDVALHVWDVATGEELFVDRQHSSESENSWVEGVVSPNGKILASIGSDGLVVLWDMESNEELLQFDGESAGLWADFSPDGTHLAIAGDDETIRIWNLSSLPSEPRLENRISYSGTTLAFLRYSPDGARLVAGGEDGYVRLWGVRTGELELILSGYAGKHWPLVFNEDGTRLFSASGDNIMEWDITPGRELLTLSGRIGTSPFSSDGEKLALIGADNSLSIVNTHTGEMLVPAWQAQSDWVEDAAWSPDGNLLATSSGYFNVFRNDYSAKIWDASNGQLVKDISIDWGYHLLAWSPDSSRLVASSFYSGTTFIWDTSSWDLLVTHPSATADFALSISPDGERIATSSMNKITVWDAVIGIDMFTYTTNATPLALVFSPDGQYLAAGLTTGNILLFKFSEGEMEIEEPGFAGGDAIVWSLAFSPDGTLLAAGDGAGKMWVWEVKSRQRRLELQTFADPVTRLTFSPDGSRLLASIDRGITYVYVLPLEELTELVRSRIILPMTEEECREYLSTATCPAWP